MTFEWLALLIFLFEYPQYFGRQYPISYYATLPHTHWIFSLCYLIAAVCFWVFAQFHLKNHLGVPIKTFAFSMFCFATTALIPYVPSESASSFLHYTFTALAFSTFIVAIFLVAKGEQRPHREISYAAGILSAILLAALVLLPKDSAFIFTLEAGSWFICQLWIIWISFRGESIKYGRLHRIQ